MSKEELVELVDRVFVLWNRARPETNLKTFYDAWWSVLCDVSFDDALAAVMSMALADESTMPRAGTVRRRVLELDGGLLSGLEAWGVVQRLRESVGSGSFVPVGLHPVLRETLRVTGLGLVTNQDRNEFLRVYERQVGLWRGGVGEG